MVLSALLFNGRQNQSLISRFVSAFNVFIVIRISKNKYNLLALLSLCLM